MDKNTNESVIVETVDNDLYINCRQIVGNKRAYAWSQDQGESFSELKYSDTLIEPQCQASMIRYTTKDDSDKSRILFSNPASKARKNLTVRISYDECQSWNEGRTLHAGPAAYSDLCILEDNTVGCLYESGEESPYERLTWARMDREWLTQE